MGFEFYLVKSANGIFSLLKVAKDHPRDKEALFREATDIACDTLTRAADDSDFRSTAEKMTGLRFDIFGSTTQEFNSILRNPHAFEYFLYAELELMLAQGVDPGLAEDLVNKCRLEAKSVEDRAQTSDEILEAVRILRDRACDQYKTLSQRSANTRKAVEMEAQLWKLTIGIGGAALIGLNAAVAVTTGLATAGLTTAGAAVSSALGGAILQSATTSTPNTQTAGDNA